MSGIEIVASVIGVAGAGFQLSLVLNAISCEFANAPHEIRAISKSVTLYSHLLKQTAAVLQQADSVHSQEAIRTTEQVLQESNAVFNDISDMLDRVRTRKPDGTVSPSVPQKMRWCFKKHRIEYLLGRMDRLQMSLSLMLQIIQLGTTLASASRHDSPARVQRMTNKFQRERVEAQTVVIQYFQTSQVLDRLYMAAREEETEPTSPIEFRKDDFDSDALTLVSSQDSQLAKIEQLPQQSEQIIAISHHRELFLNLGENWNKLGASKDDMIKYSEEMTNRLLDRWTVWREKRDRELQRHSSSRGSRYNPIVQDSHDDDEIPYHEKYQERDDSPTGKFLEGPTMDWRHPHSVEARQEANRRRKAFQPYQASVEGSSELEDSPGSNSSRKRPARKYIVDSDPETSESENERVGEKAPRRRRSSAAPVLSQPKSKYADEISVSQPSSNAVPVGASQQPPPNAGSSRPPLLPAWSQYTPQQRPFASPDQNRQHHSFTSPTLTGYTNNTGQYPYTSPMHGQPPQGQYPPPYAPYTPSVAYPYGQPPHYVPRLSPQNSRQGQVPQRSSSQEGSPRPKSRDGKPPKSPSRLSREYTAADYKAYEEERKRQKRDMRRHIGDGATKGLLAGGGLAVLLEALDVLDF